MTRGLAHVQYPALHVVAEMKKRRRAEVEEDADPGDKEADVSIAAKKSKKGEDALDKLSSLLSTEGSIVAGMLPVYDIMVIFS